MKTTRPGQNKKIREGQGKIRTLSLEIRIESDLGKKSKKRRKIGIGTGVFSIKSEILGTMRRKRPTLG